MITERCIEVDKSTISRWVIKLTTFLDKAFRKKKRPVGSSWRVDEIYVKVKGKWKYLFRAVDKAGQTPDFLLCASRDKTADTRFFEKAAIATNGESEKVTIETSCFPQPSPITVTEPGGSFRRSELVAQAGLDQADTIQASMIFVDINIFVVAQYGEVLV
ncbi:hypothetical protein BUE93_09345 [Chromobacterium amazonense]|uniref:DDE domain-containing protein n=1 Tax=Chromobacterium amazonense TaxID=1382803 RepID=A0A2S9X5D4_9NEIS|nr:hypothetical protein BUE93_09345 [Chromobacterium amazonense]